MSGRRIALVVGACVLACAWVVWIAPWRPVRGDPHEGLVAGAAGDAQVGDAQVGPVSAQARARVAELERRAAAGDTAAQRELGQWFRDAHRPVEAVLPLTAYLRANPDNREAWLDLADSHAAANAFAESRDVLLAMLERFPGDATALYDMGAVLANLGDREGARTWFERAAGAGDASVAVLARQALDRLERDR